MFSLSVKKDIKSRRKGLKEFLSSATAIFLQVFLFSALGIVFGNMLRTRTRIKVIPFKKLYS